MMKLALTLAMAMAATTMSPVTAAEDLPSYTALDNGGTKTLLVAYADEDAHINVVSQTLKMQTKGKKVKEMKNHKFKKERKLKNKAGGKANKKGKAKEKGSRFLQEDATTTGYSVIEVETDDIKAEIEALRSVEGVVAIEIDDVMHVLSTSYQQKLRGSAADHMKDIQDAIKTAADQLSKEDGADHDHERRLAEQTPYGITMTRANELWDINPPENAEPIKICVVDTGYDHGHEDLPTAAYHGVAGFTPTGSAYDGQVWTIDADGHGTHCAGTIGAIGDNGAGVTSVNPDPFKFRFFIGKGLTDSGSGTGTGVMESVQACVNAGAKVISMSLGGGNFHPLFNAQYEEHYDDNGE